MRILPDLGLGIIVVLLALPSVAQTQLNLFVNPLYTGNQLDSGNELDFEDSILSTVNLVGQVKKVISGISDGNENISDDEFDTTPEDGAKVDELNTHHLNAFISKWGIIGFGLAMSILGIAICYKINIAIGKI